LNKKKIIKDPVYGFITIPTPLVQELIDHPKLQRMRRIKQLGLADLIYPGATHSRFHHALGAMHLMVLALEALRTKGVRITDPEFEGAVLAILMHDLGHGPFSHVLENMILPGIPHEKMSERIIEHLNLEFDGKLSLALQIFRGKYKKKFLNQLVSGQLDVDRLDYLARDSFYTGVDEGKVGADRIIKMLNVKKGDLVVEEKALYSLENFLSARRLMYWQVYLHKTTLSVEKMLESIWLRARELNQKGELDILSEAVEHFLKRSTRSKKINLSDLKAFVFLDDHDIWMALKTWGNHPDTILSRLCRDLMNRRLFQVELREKKIPLKELEKESKRVGRALQISKDEAKFFVKTGIITNSAYIREKSHILILKKDGRVIDIVDAADLPNIKAMAKRVKKHYFSFPKKLYLQLQR
jgi:uncharacterized protein